MFLRNFLCLILTLAIVGCASPAKKEKEKKKKEEAAETIKDASSDVSFQAFLGRLRIAAQTHDMQTLASMMTSDFGFSWTQQAGDNVFKYWDDNGVWPELNQVLHERFAPKGKYMVAPEKFAEDADSYHGYRAGIMMINGSWKFAYFVTDPSSAPASTQAPAPSPTPDSGSGVL